MSMTYVALISFAVHLISSHLIYSSMCCLLLTCLPLHDVLRCALHSTGRRRRLRAHKPLPGPSPGL